MSVRARALQGQWSSVFSTGPQEPPLSLSLSLSLMSGTHRKLGEFSLVVERTEGEPGLRSRSLLYHEGVYTTPAVRERGYGKE